MLISGVSLLVGFILLVAGAALLVHGASRLASALKVSPLVIGLTVVAYGTSMPELVVSANAALNQQAGIALGNVVGSNIFNILGILGFSALVGPLIVSSRLVRVDVPLMIGVSLVLLVMALDGTVGRIDGALLLLGLTAYTVVTWLSQRRSSTANGQDQETLGDSLGSHRISSTGMNVGFVVIGLLMLVFGAQQTVDGAIEAAQALQVSDLIIGLTVVAIGTSLPELATSVMATFRGERDLAVGNVVGSNIFNILGVQGLASVVSWTGVPVDPTVMRFDLLVMIAASVACLPIFFTGYAIVRWEGILFVGYLVAYMAYLFLQASEREVLGRLFGTAMIGFVIPLTIVTLTVVVWRELRARKLRRMLGSGPSTGI